MLFLILQDDQSAVIFKSRALGSLEMSGTTNPAIHNHIWRQTLSSYITLPVASSKDTKQQWLSLMDWKMGVNLLKSITLSNIIQYKQ
jgi:hypothetical protein